MRRGVTLLLALVLGAGSAGIVGCGGKTNPHLLSAGRASRVQQALDEVRQAVDDHNCAGATRAVARLQQEVASLPRDTDPGLRRRLEEGTAALAQQAPVQCNETKTTPTVTETTTIPTTTVTTTTPTTSTTTTPTTTTTTPTTTTTTPTTPTTTTPGSGGATPTTTP
jgi:hypothetical protein